MQYFRKIFSIIMCIGIIMICGLLSSCADGSKLEGKIFFSANMFEGKTFKENTGTCVYDNGKVNKLYRDWWIPSANKSGTKLLGFTYYTDNCVKYADLTTGTTRNISLNHRPGSFKWLSDNNRLLYYGSDLIAPLVGTPTNIYLVDLNNRTEKQLTNYLNDDDQIYRMELSPDEKYVVYSYANDSMKLDEIYCLNLDDGTITQLPFSSGAFIWSSMTNKIILDGMFTQNGNIEYGPRLMIYDPETKEIVKFAKNRDRGYLCITDFAESPDGKSIAYVRNERDGRLTLWTMDPDGTNEKMILDPHAKIDSISWSK